MWGGWIGAAGAGIGETWSMKQESRICREHAQESPSPPRPLRQRPLHPPMPPHFGPDSLQA